MSSRAIIALLDRIAAESIELHSIMVVRQGHIIAEGWWAPYSAERPHLLYSLTKSFTSMAVGMVIVDGLLSLDDRVVDVLPEHVPADVSEQGRRLTVHHLLSMTAGHAGDSLGEAWELEPDDLVKGFLRVPFTEPEGTRHTYDNATTFILARMVERVTGRGLPEFLDERLFTPMGIESPEWDRVASGLAFGFHGLHLTTEAVAAFGELLLRGGRWGDQQLVPREWVELATRQQVETLPVDDEWATADFLCGYGYQVWMSRHGYFGNGAFGQQCIVVPEHDLVIAVTSALDERQPIPGIFWDHLLPGPVDPADDELLAERLKQLSIAPVSGAPGRSAKATVDASAADSALPAGTAVVVEAVDGGWLLELGAWPAIEVGHGEWRESSPLGRAVVASGAWQGETFVGKLYVIPTPHHVRLQLDAATGIATATWNGVPLTGPNLELLIQSPLMTRPDVA
ncbi:class A beta-lactamase-related serine hydrolase [Kribbella antibiotica]|uniref:Class A beta-lactamase-related serine hydrolase n=2 Tax=Kribbella antibiotica TaxID=190195 RepID=A0A4R4YN52_9ACTN|nr:class A beta-lactamase-related serine hydrolase [Kribbella antibiotica]